MCFLWSFTHLYLHVLQSHPKCYMSSAESLQLRLCKLTPWRSYRLTGKANFKVRELSKHGHVVLINTQHCEGEHEGRDYIARQLQLASD